MTLTVRDGCVADEFIALARRDRRTPTEEARLDVLKREMAERVMAAAADDVYDAEIGCASGSRPRAARPPSTAHVAPVTKLASSERRCATTAATSSGRPRASEVQWRVARRVGRPAAS